MIAKILSSLFVNTSNAKLHSAMGFLLGDMLGAPFESKSAKEASQFFLKKVGSYTDDTLMYLSVLKAFKKKLPLSKTLIEFFDPKRGYGNRMHEMLSKKQCIATDSWGNGSATRTAALALFEQASLNDVIQYSKLTHLHPEAIRCSKAVFLAVKQALNHCKDLKKSWEILGEKKELNSYSMGLKASESIPVAFLVFQKSESFLDTLKNAISLGGDTDSIGALAGALAGAYYKVPPSFIKIAQKEKTILTLIKKYLP